MSERELQIRKIAIRIIKSLFKGFPAQEDTESREWEKVCEVHRHFLQKLRKESYWQEQYYLYQEVNAPDDWQKLQSRIKQSQHRRQRRFNLISYAALAVLLIGTSLTIGKLNKEQQSSKFPVAEILPSGKTKAILELADGRQIHLEKVVEKKVLSERGIRQSNTGLVYQDTLPLSPEYHTLRIPRGGEYTLVLNDGTQVWLNSGTILRYPNRFSGPTRQIHIEGEAFFKVAPDRDHPFIVSTDDIEINVTGTEFNVHSYPEEKQITTTLVSGKVNLVDRETSVALKPGEQGVFRKGQNGFSVREVDTVYYISWKNGTFEFDDMPLYEIIPQLERWYDVDIRFETPQVGDIRFSGAVKKEKSMVFILNMIRNTKAIDYRITEGTVWLRKKQPE